MVVAEHCQRVAVCFGQVHRRPSGGHIPYFQNRLTMAYRRAVEEEGTRIGRTSTLPRTFPWQPLAKPAPKIPPASCPVK
jgi:hypothetical protein